MYIAKRITAAAIAALMALTLSCCAAERAQTLAENPLKASSAPSPVPTPTPSPTPTPKPISPEVQALMGQNAQTALERNKREYMTGRLVIPSGEVQPGDRAYILRGESILSLECEAIFDGLNSGMGVTDADGIPATLYAEYICYTCGTDWTNVKIVGFNVIDEDLF